MKVKKLNDGIKASVAIFLATLITKGISYITSPIFTRILTPKEYGTVTIYVTWATIIGVIATFSLSAGVFNNGMVDFENDRDDFSFSMLILSNLITFVCAGIFYIIFPYVKNFINLEPKFLILMFVIFLFEPAYLFWNARQRYEYKYKCSFIVTVLMAILMPLTAILLVLSDKIDNVSAKIYGTYFVALVIYFTFYIFLMIKSKCKTKVNYWKYAFLFNLPLIPHYLSAYVLNSSDKIMIANLVGESETAYYSVAYSIAAIVMIVWSSINPSLVPYTYEKCKSGEHDKIAKVTQPLLLVFFAGCIGVILFAPEVIAIMGGKAYRDAVYVIPPIVAGVFFQASYYIYANVVYYYKKPKYVMYASVIAAVVNIVLNYIFIKMFGYLAAGYTTLVSYVIQASIDYWAMKKVVGKSIYNMKYIGALSFAIIAVALISNILYKFIFVRYTLIIALIVILFISRNRIIKIIKSVKSRGEEA